ncbi:MAG: hypothetical protein SOS24_05165 [Clostridia bacterium]|nr:hypothetical protein [Clostridia bacterium]
MSGYDLWDIVLMFFIYGFMGWCLEVAFFGVTEGKFVNRGFLNGPICPIYGFGAMIVIMLLLPLKKNIALLYICSVLITSLLEFVTGLVLEKLYHVRWWDYSDRPFNIMGHVCLSFSLAWGIACVVVMYVIHPPIAGTVTKLNGVAEIIIVSILLAVFISDVAVTVATLKKLRLRLRKMHEIADKMHEISEEIGERVFEVTESAVKKYDEIKESEEFTEFKEKYDAIKERADIKELKEKYNKLAVENGILQKRIIKAFPGMKSKNHSKFLESIKTHIHKPTKK